MKKVCNTCVLPETFPHITFNNEGVCNFCQRFVPENLEEAKKKYKQKFLDLIKTRKDVVVAYSGGKDSTYTVLLLKEVYGMNVTTLTFDNHFISPQAWRNIDTVCRNLNVTNINYQMNKTDLFPLFRHALEHEMYSKKSMERASTLCTTCSGIFKAMVLTYAIEFNIPLIGFGWSPGQAPVSSAIAKYMSSFTKISRNVMIEAIKNISPNVAFDIRLTDTEERAINDREIFNVHPLAFEDYNEQQILKDIKDLGWKEPNDVDTNSTNCRLNCLANKTHMEMYSFHPYAWEIANMVRQGTMPREEGMVKIYNTSNNNVDKIKEELYEV